MLIIPHDRFNPCLYPVLSNWHWPVYPLLLICQNDELLAHIWYHSLSPLVIIQLFIPLTNPLSSHCAQSFSVPETLLRVRTQVIERATIMRFVAGPKYAQRPFGRYEARAWCRLRFACSLCISLSLLYWVQSCGTSFHRYHSIRCYACVILMIPYRRE